MPLYRWLAPDAEENRARVRGLYDRLSARYTARRRGGPLAWLAARDLEAVLSLLAPRAGQRALDVGCGDGRHAALLGGIGLEVWAVDFAPRMAAAAAGHAARVLCRAIDEPGGLALGVSFDRILCIGVLDFVRDPAACVADLSRHLAPGGRLVVQAPRRGLLALPYALWQRLRNGVRVHLLDWRPLDAAARREGLQLAARRNVLHTFAICWVRPA